MSGFPLFTLPFEQRGLGLAYEAFFAFPLWL